jgi:Asp-tRNA(Asn)/Glu-tRNA(Gln) amidotransferase A subunit family amidase
MSELAYLSATEALARFRTRELSPVELTRAVIERAEAVEPRVGALADTFYDEALSQAKEAEASYAGNGPEPRPLEGILVAIKDEEPHLGRRNTFGSLIYKDNIADHNSPIVQRVLDAGGIVHARTRTPEFSCMPFTHSRLWGVTHNPWNLEYDTGGSSGGAAAALASGMTTLASGSDIGGSIRIPASCCGVVGFKPPYGRVPQEPPFNLDHYCHVGPLARTVADCLLFENAIAGPHPADVVSIRPKLTIPSDTSDIRGWRIAYSLTLGDYNVHPDVAANTLAAVERFRAAGAVVEEVELTWKLDQIRTAAYAHFRSIMGAGIEQTVRDHADLVCDYTRGFSAMLGPGEAGDVYRGLEIEGALYAEFGALMERFDLFVCPTLGLPALAAGESYVDRNVQLNGFAQRPFDHLMTIPFNILSRCPVMSVPSGLSSDGVPTGIQIVGHTYDDASVFSAAAAYERVQPWLDHADRRPRF